MYTYEAYGLCFHSDLELPGLPEGNGSPDVSIRLDALDEASLAEEPNRGRRIFGRIYDDLFFLVEEGSSVTVDVRSDIEIPGVRTYVMGVLMAILLRQRGLLALHACAVARDGEAIGFVGESGWGKSTLAEYFCRKGYTLINDDILAIRTNVSQRPHVEPGYPQIRLRPDAGRHLRTDFEELPRVTPTATKRLSSVSDFPRESLPLKRLFILEKEFADATSLEELPPQEAILRLSVHTRVTHLFHFPDTRARHLEQCADVVRHVPILRLHRVRSLDALPEVFSVVENELNEE